MPSKKPKQIISALNKKGFIQKEGDHHFFYFTDKDGKIITNIRTKVSHDNKKDYSDNLLQQMKKQLKLDSIEDLINLIDCPLTEKELRTKLQSKTNAQL